MIPYNATYGLAVYICYNETAMSYFYNTMVILNVASPSDISVSPGHNLAGKRLVLRLFYVRSSPNVIWL